MKTMKEFTSEQIKEMVLNVFPAAINWYNFNNYYSFNVGDTKYFYYFVDQSEDTEITIHEYTDRKEDNYHYVCTVKL